MPLSRMILRTQSHWWVFTKQTYCHFTISYRLIPIAMARIIKFLSVRQRLQNVERLVLRSALDSLRGRQYEALAIPYIRKMRVKLI